MADGTINYVQFTNLINSMDIAQEAKVKINDKITGIFHYSLRTFSYSAGATVASTAPTCTAAFARTFDHQDWRDGEDLVQAGGVEGFNIRFNALKADLDRINTDLEHAFQCLAGLRGSVSTALVEIRDQLNTINKDIYECCNDKIDSTVTPVNPGTYYPYYPYFPYEVNPVVPTGPNPGPVINPYDKYKDKILINADNPNEALIKGVEGTRIDTMTLHGKAMDVWRTNFGMVLVDSPKGDAVKPTFTPSDMADVTNFTRYVAEKGPDVERAFPQGFAVKDLLDQFGTDPLLDGSTLAETLKTLDADTRFAGLGALEDSVINTHVDTIVTSGLNDATLIGTLGLHTSVAPANVAVSSLKTLDTGVAAALTKAGINTVGKLATADPAALTRALGGNTGEAGALGGIAKTLIKLGGRL
ncbi:hypothetical protein E4Q23_19485 [Candidatus Accumulibacter phosphatis]|jgi:hypothetical protein|uniref:Uncharacterized protein n=1 Tax=Candidatus Accumulibacter phosphatis TaxID=327160 RepID=A0ABX1TZR1_9PROT|nr:hypothetical protein [Candidatus Accumulibacter phosphatis]NMQ29756.1 hypothetical protein [Candidatus Accumulibacter phosphatis]